MTVQAHIDDLQREVERRKEMLVAAFLAERHVAPSAVQLQAQQAGPAARVWSVKLRDDPPFRLRAWLSDLGWKLRPKLRHYQARLAREFHELGLRADRTLVCERIASGALEVSFVDAGTLQARCHLCRARVALSDLPRHVEKRHRRN